MPTATISSTHRDALERLKRAALSQLAQRPPAEVAEAEAKHRERNKMFYCYPEAGQETPDFPFSREKYPRHLEFFRAGKEHCERPFTGGNRTGKTYAARFEIAFHMTGFYPAWWEGYRFKKPTKWWITHATWKDVRDVNQAGLLGQPDDENALGTGSIPKHLICSVVPNPHIKNGYESFRVKHVTGGVSTGQFKTYEQGWKAFESHRVNGIWLDELCPVEIYGSCQARTVNTEGGKTNDMIILTFTPVEGLSDLLLQLTERAVNRESLPW